MFLNKFDTVKIAEGVEGIFIENNRFNTTLISLNFYMPLKSETISANTLLTYVLSTCSGKFGGLYATHGAYRTACTGL